VVVVIGRDGLARDAFGEIVTALGDAGTYAEAPRRRRDLIVHAGTRFAAIDDPDGALLTRLPSMWFERLVAYPVLRGVAGRPRNLTRFAIATSREGFRRWRLQAYLSNLRAAAFLAEPVASRTHEALKRRDHEALIADLRGEDLSELDLVREMPPWPDLRR
jgi:hypothetical protein